MTTFTFEAIGTHWQIDILQDISAQKSSSLEENVKQRIAIFDNTYSRFIETSLISQIAKQSGEYVLPADAKALFLLYKQLYELTEGLFTPLIGQTLSDSGYDADYSLKEKVIKKTPSWEESIEFLFPKLHVKKPVLLDFGAAGKGYLIDIIAELLVNNDLYSFTIDASGDIVHKDTVGKTLRIGLEHPLDTKQIIGVATISNQSICASATNRRAWGSYNHIINPVTLASPKNILATWVIAKDGLTADALATCLFFVKAEKLLHYYAFEYCILYADYSVEKSNGKSIELFTN